MQSWIRDSTPLIAYSRYWISVELGFWIPIVSGILDSLSCISDSKAQDSGFHISKFPEFWIPDSWKVGRLNQNPSKVAPKAKFPTGLAGKNGWAVPGVCIEPVDEKLTWIPHVLELKKSFVKKLDLLKKWKFLPRSVRHFFLSDLWSYTVGFLLQLWLISVSRTASLQGCETYFWFTQRHGVRWSLTPSPMAQPTYYKFDISICFHKAFHDRLPVTLIGCITN